MYNDTDNAELYQEAVSAGCTPKWYDGMFGPAWHCGCPKKDHACDSQCSALTFYSVQQEVKEVKKTDRFLDILREGGVSDLFGEESL